MSEVRIARFVDIEACRSIFSDYSTFVLRSSEHYTRRYEMDRGDERELRVRVKGGGSAETSCFVLSCWTILDGDHPTRDEWGIFQDSVVAIVSTPGKVCAFLEKAFELKDEKTQGSRRYPFMFVKHNPVQYANEVDDDITPENIMDITVFTKRSKFAKQKEYRFALPFNRVPHVIDTYIFAMRPDDYMDKCFANPEMSREHKIQLLHILGNAMGGYGHFGHKKMSEIIANANILYSIF